MAACSTSPRSESGKTEQDADVARAMDTFRKGDAGVNKIINESYGYAIFPSVGKGAVGVGGAYGKGQVFEQGTRVGYCDLTQASIGLALGGQAYSELICFENKAALDKFKTGNFTFAAQATAVALKSGAGANAKYADGVVVFTAGEAGLMYEAAIGGQKFSYRPL
jgi:lipid-binding SYLF domain-containing protein